MTKSSAIFTGKAVFLTVLFLFSFAFSVAPAKAQVYYSPSGGANASQIQALQAQVQSLLAQIAALQGSQGSTATGLFTRNLGYGARGNDVFQLQLWLIQRGYTIPAGATGYFGPQTQYALATFQATNGIYPAVGYFGPLTRSHVIALMGAEGNQGGYYDNSQNQGGLSGGSGTLTNISTLGDIESSLQEGDGPSRILGFSARARGSDIAIQRIDVEFTIPAGSGSSNIDHYIDSVSLYQDGRRLATMDASTGDKDSRVWNFRFSDLNGTIREGDTSDLYVEVTPVSSIGASEDGVSITVAIPSDGIRAIDATGISETYMPNGSNSESFTVSGSNTGTFTLLQAGSNPTNTVVKADTSNPTYNVTLLAFSAHARGQDLTVNDIPVGLTAAGTANAGDVVQSLQLMRGSTVLRTVTVPTGTGVNAQALFTNLNQHINSDSTQDFTVVATIRRLGTGSSGSSFDSGDSVYASVSSGSSNWNVEDTNGHSVSPHGTVTGGVITFQTTGITVTKLNTSAMKTGGQHAGEGDITQYAITFNVTADDTDIYIDRSIQNTRNPQAAGAGIAWATTTSSSVGVTNTNATNFSSNSYNSGDTATSYRVLAGTSRTFTVNVAMTATALGFTGVELTGINYGTGSNTDTSTTYFTAGLDSFRTADISMTVH